MVSVWAHCDSLFQGMGISISRLAPLFFFLNLVFYISEAYTYATLQQPMNESYYHTFRPILLHSRAYTILPDFDYQNLLPTFSFPNTCYHSTYGS